MRLGYVLVLVVLALVAFVLYARGGMWGSTNDRMSATSMDAVNRLTISSSEFQNGASIPARFTCDGENTSLPLAWSGVPADTQSLVMLMDDPDIPQVFKEQRGIDSFDHWTLFNIPPAITEIAASSTAGVSGANGAGQNAYTGPCPPPQYEPSEHRYFFRLYALDSLLSLKEGATKKDVLTAMQGHILGQAELVGMYKRH